MKCSVVLLVLIVASACSYAVSLPSANATVSPPTTNVTTAVPLTNMTVSPSTANVTSPASSSPTPTPTLPNEVAVHILERFEPFDTETYVGPIESVVIPSGFCLMTTFKAYEFSPTHAATMDCFFVNSEFQWVPMTTKVESAQQHTGEPAFCARRDLADDETTFAVAQFDRLIRHTFGPYGIITRTFADAVSSAKLVDHAKSRGWMELPLASFRVTKLQHWQSAPVLTLVKEMYALGVNKDQAGEHCLPDPTGLVERKLEGGDYYAGVEGEKPVLLCVSYAKRGLQDVYPREMYLTSVRFRDSVFWRKSCGMIFFDMEPTSIYYKDTYTPVPFRPYKGKKRFLCYTETPLTEGENEAKDLEDPSRFAKRVFFDEQFEKRNERLRVEYHEKTAWDFPETAIDMDAVKKF